MLISFLITHYNRPQSLATCINSIHHHVAKINYEIIISDDCSKKENIEKIKQLNYDKLILSKQNTGLASNINRGIDKCQGQYIVYIQEDFGINQEFANQIDHILKILDKDKIEMIRLRSNVNFKTYHLIQGYFKLIPRFAPQNFLIDHYRYSDHPYVVKTNFFKKFGYYKENVNTSYGENEYMIRMMKLNPKIAICKNECVDSYNFEGSIREENHLDKPHPLFKLKNLKPIKRILNSLRFKIEYLFYRPQKRSLYTFENLRK